MIRANDALREDTNVSPTRILTPNDDHLTDEQKIDRWKLYKQTPAYLRDLVWLSSQSKGV